jgi:hypothetical protein
MPRVPDASSVTRLRALQSSAVADPTKRSASYVPRTPSLLYSLRASDAGRGMFPGQTYLSSPIACGYVNPRHQGLITSPPPLQRITMDLDGFDFSGWYVDYEFGADVYPPAFDFEAVILVAEGKTPVNIDQVTSINIFDGSGDDLYDFTNTTIATSPAWIGSTFTSSITQPYLSATAGTFPGVSTVITFRNVPMGPNLVIRLYGAN